MTHPDHLLFWSAFLLMLGAAVVCDLAERRIPNGLIVLGLMAASIRAVLVTAGHMEPGPFGLADFKQAVFGAATGLALMLPFYALGSLGAGDVKLMAVVGAFLGPWPVLGAALLTFASGGLFALAFALATRSLPRVLGNLRLMGLILLSGRQAGVALRDVATTGRLPYALAIATGSLGQCLLAGQPAWPFQ